MKKSELLQAIESDRESLVKLEQQFLTIVERLDVEFESHRSSIGDSIYFDLERLWAALDSRNRTQNFSAGRKAIVDRSSELFAANREVKNANELCRRSVSDFLNYRGQYLSTQSIYLSWLDTNRAVFSLVESEERFLALASDTLCLSNQPHGQTDSAATL